MKKLFSITLLMMSLLTAQAERVKDVAQLAGVRNNQLVGYGLVVGLDGTGDKTGVKFTEQSFRNMLIKLGINIPAGTKLDSKNIAAVLVTADLPPFMKPGQKIDITVSSIGTAKSLRGGTLLMTPLKGADAKTYAMGQGHLVVGGFGISGGDGSRITVNVPSVGRIPNGASVERAVSSPFTTHKDLIYNLHSPDFTTAKRLSDAINKTMGKGTASAMDAASVKISAPKDMNQRVQYISVVENIELSPASAPARIIVNSRTGTVVIGQNVRVSAAAVAHGNLTVTISENPTVSQPNPLATGETVVVPQSEIKIQEEKNRAFVFSPGASLRKIVKAINAVGAAPGDLVAILEALKQVGALHAELIII